MKIEKSANNYFDSMLDIVGIWDGLCIWTSQLGLNVS